jgi:uncharacterized protein (TIGR02145 family)
MELWNYLIDNGYNWDSTTTGNKIGKSLAAKTGWLSSPTAGNVGNDTLTNNTSGFNAPSGGSRNNSANFYDIERFGEFWSSSAINPNEAWIFYVYYGSAQFSQSYVPKEYGFSVRLVRD